jgi:hypothetical protein
MSPREHRVARHRLAVHPHEPASLAHPASLSNMGQYSFYLRRGEAGLKERSPLTLGKAGVARAALEQPPASVLPVAHTHRQITDAPLAVIGAGCLLTAKARKVVHG